MEVTAALWLYILMRMFQVAISQSTIELHPWSLPEARYFFPLLIMMASLQILALWPRRLAIFCPEEI
jgi:hypothetical protein